MNFRPLEGRMDKDEIRGAPRMIPRDDLDASEVETQETASTPSGKHELAGVNKIVGSLRGLFAKRKAEQEKRWDRVKISAQDVRTTTEEYLRQLEKMLRDSLGPMTLPGERFSFFVGADNPRNQEWFRFQIMDNARAMGYLPDLAAHNAWVRLVAKTVSRHEILVHIHGLGPSFQGVLVATACAFRKEQGKPVSNITPLAEAPFRFQWNEPVDATLQRYREWLEEVLIAGGEAVMAAVEQSLAPEETEEAEAPIEEEDEAAQDEEETPEDAPEADVEADVDAEPDVNADVETEAEPDAMAEDEEAESDVKSEEMESEAADDSAVAAEGEDAPDADEDVEELPAEAEEVEQTDSSDENDASEDGADDVEAGTSEDADEEDIDAPDESPEADEEDASELEADRAGEEPENASE